MHKLVYVGQCLFPAVTILPRPQVQLPTHVSAEISA
jgi:hypothetical protein